MADPCPGCGKVHPKVSLGEIIGLVMNLTQIESDPGLRELAQNAYARIWDKVKEGRKAGQVAEEYASVVNTEADKIVTEYVQDGVDRDTAVMILNTTLMMAANMDNQTEGMPVEELL